MKVLLVGEFSGVHNNLKVGLEALGVQVTLANTGDGFKQFSSDILMHIDSDTSKARIENAFLEYYNLFKMQQYDVVQIMHPNAFSFYNHSQVFKLLDKAKVVVQLIGGCDYVFAKKFKFLNSELCRMCKQYDQKKHSCPYETANEIKYEREIYKRADVLVPMAWEYYRIYKEYATEYNTKLHTVIPMPIDTRKNRVLNKQHEKIQVFHPINREGFKGTKIFRPIFTQLQEEYGKIAEFKIAGRMPIEQYRKYLASVDIVVDQLYSCTYGMNALYAMAMGKVVMSGNSNTEMFRDIEWLQDMPVLSLGYTGQEIKMNISNVIKDHNLRDLKERSRKYVEIYHDAKSVAKVFLDLYRQC